MTIEDNNTHTSIVTTVLCHWSKRNVATVQNLQVITAVNVDHRLYRLNVCFVTRVVSTMRGTQK